MKKINVKLKHNSYLIRIKPGLLEQSGRLLVRTTPSESIVVISDETVTNLYGDTLLKNLRDNSVKAKLITVPDGENSKSLESVKYLYSKLIELKIKRDSSIIALGGGVVGDLAGFTAATYLRGIPYIQIPTTLLAQVDSSVGGKTAVNHPQGKNLIGSFYQPQTVLIDPLVLQTLDKREITSGLGEVIKYSLISNTNLLKLLENDLTILYTFSDINKISQIIYQCCRIKTAIVEKDEKENHLRKILNFGHTIGHALEAVTNYSQFRHGEAVLYGIKWAVFVSKQRGFIKESDFKRIKTLIAPISLPPIPETVNQHNLFSKTLIDKKQSYGGLNIILLESMGKAEIFQEDDLKQYIKTWLEYEKNQ